MSIILQKEALFTEQPDRKSLLPIRFPAVWKMYKDLQASSWTAEEVTFRDDISQIKNGQVPSEILDVVEFILGFFSGADTIVNENLAENFLSVIKILEANCFYGMQIQNENVHNETYANTIVAYYKDEPERKESILNAITTMPCVKKLFEWCQRWIQRTPENEIEENMDSIKQYLEDHGYDVEDKNINDIAYIWCTAKRLVAFASVEGIMFSAAFCIIFWIKEQGILPGLTFSNELISADEGQHRDFAALMYSMIEHKPLPEHSKEIIEDAVKFKDEFVEEMLSVRLTGMNAGLMKQYVRFTANSLSKELGLDVIYEGVTNPFPFMDKISINGQTNFFEKRVSEYNIAGFEDGNTKDFTLDEDEEY